MRTKVRSMVEHVLLGDVQRLRHVLRYSASQVHHRENTAEHSFYVTYYAMMIGHWYMRTVQRRGQAKLDMSLLLQRAVMHDCEEAITGDFPRHFKYSSDSLREHIEQASACCLHKMLRELQPSIDGHTVAHLKECWTHAKANDLEGDILRLADYLEAVGYVATELLHGNRVLLEQCSSMVEYSRYFNSPRFEVFDPIVQQIREFECKYLPELFPILRENQ